MKKKWLFVTTWMVLLLSSFNAYGEDSGEDKTLSPYFFVKSEDASIDQMPLKSTGASVKIAGVIADVLVTQVYKNEGKSPLEAIYVFPASSRAAVYGMKMTIGSRVIEAKIKKREDARKEYEQARDTGKSASLLEQQRPNVFQMNVANIMPGDEIKVELRYTELLVPEEGIYEFVYPTVVGPRYSNKPASETSTYQTWTKNPYLRQGQAPSYTFDINVCLNAGMPISDITCSSHKVNTAYTGKETAIINLDKTQANAGNKDFILKYRLEGNRIQSGLLLTETGKEKFFLLMMQPPKKVKLSQIPGREYFFIVDVSGSMHGYPLDISKKLLKDLIGRLRPSDCFNVLLFSGGSTVLSNEPLAATKENIAKAISLIDNQNGAGGTEILPALKRALAMKKHEHYSRTFIIATDGYVSVEDEAFDLIQKNLNKANLFAFGIGTSVNRHLIEGLARCGMGEPFVITKPEDAPRQAERFRQMIDTPALTEIKIEYSGFDVYDVQPLSIPDIFSQRPVIVFGKYKGSAEGKITLSGYSGEGRHSETIDVSKEKPAAANTALRYLWARHKITLLSDYNLLGQDDPRIKEVCDLGLRYNLLTAYTSFVAIDTEVRNKNGKPATVKQPLPLPEGVSDYAVGGVANFCQSSQMKMSMPAREMSAQALPGAPCMEKKDLEKLKGNNIPALIIESIKTKGIPKDIIELAIKAALADMGKCLSSGSGKIKIEVEIGYDGTVISSTVNAKNKSCLEKVLKKLRFGMLEKPATATIVLKY